MKLIIIVIRKRINNFYIHDNYVPLSIMLPFSLMILCISVSRMQLASLQDKWNLWKKSNKVQSRTSCLQSFCSISDLLNFINELHYMHIVEGPEITNYQITNMSFIIIWLTSVNGSVNIRN